MDKDIITISETLGVDIPKLYQFSNKQNKHYSQCVIKKNNGKERKLNVPNKYLKHIQRMILKKYLYTLPISKYATAYCPGKSLTDNVGVHINKKTILKLDISGFFDSIDYEMVYAVIKKLGLSTAATTLLSNICILNSKLPQGAPTSPYIANLVMNHFDEKVGEWCSIRDISYTRYCDDMTFSGNFNRNEVTNHIKYILGKQGFELNHQKTKCVDKSQQQSVTGIIVNAKPQISAENRRKIRQEVHYCVKYGIINCIEHMGIPLSESEYLNSLRGRIAFALQINPDDKKLHEYLNLLQKYVEEK